MIRPFFGSSRTNIVLQAALQGYELRHRAIVNNIANVDTPRYQRMGVSFEKQLRDLVEDLKSSGPVESGGADRERRDGSPGFSVEVWRDESPPIRADGSNVSIDREMADLAKNTQKILALTQFLSGGYRDLKAAIRGRSAG